RPARAAGRARRRRRARSLRRVGAAVVTAPPTSGDACTGRGEAPSAGGVIAWPTSPGPRGQRGQALLVLVAAMCVAVIAAFVARRVARGLGAQGRAQDAAALAALAGARAMAASYDRLFQPAYVGRRPNPLHLERAAYLASARSRALATGQLNG